MKDLAKSILRVARSISADDSGEHLDAMRGVLKSLKSKYREIQAKGGRFMWRTDSDIYGDIGSNRLGYWRVKISGGPRYGNNYFYTVEDKDGYNLRSGKGRSGKAIRDDVVRELAWRIRDAVSEADRKGGNESPMLEKYYDIREVIDLLTSYGEAESKVGKEVYVHGKMTSVADRWIGHAYHEWKKILKLKRDMNDSQFDIMMEIADFIKKNARVWAEDSGDLWDRKDTVSAMRKEGVRV